jgi:hypothetical protein
MVFKQVQGQMCKTNNCRDKNDLTDNKVAVCMKRLRTREIHIRNYMLIFFMGPVRETAYLERQLRRAGAGSSRNSAPVCRSTKVLFITFFICGVSI